MGLLCGPGLRASVAVALCAAAAGVGVVTGGCAPRAACPPGRQSMAPRRSIEAVLQDSTERWMALPGVVGTSLGQCQGEPCIKVYVAGTQGPATIPARVEGYRVVVEETGSFEAR
ncbi:MAG: hypothetical protein AB1505_07070 [Candidatus Latescibacterota bacterium]